MVDAVIRVQDGQGGTGRAHTRGKGDLSLDR